MTNTILLIAFLSIGLLILAWLAVKLTKVHRAQQDWLDVGSSVSRELVSERDNLKEDVARLEGLLEGRKSDEQIEKKRLEEIEKLLALQIKEITGQVLGEGGQKLATDAKKQVEEYLKSVNVDDDKRKAEFRAMVAPLKEALDKVEKTAREQAQGVGSIQETIRSLGKTTDNLYHALQNPSARGAWGEYTLERVAEVSGMSTYCDFSTQVTVDGEDGRLRPDMIVHLAGGREIVIDSKVSLVNYMKATESTEEEERILHLAAHAKSVKNHIKLLAGKNYQQQFVRGPEFVVMYIPGEMFYHAALKEDEGLIEFAAKSRVMIATPMILIAMLRIVAQGWHDAQLAEDAIAIRDAGVKVYDQLRIVAERIATVGKHLDKTSIAFNSLVTSYDGRLWSRAKSLSEMGCGDELPKADPKILNTRVKPVTRIGGDGNAARSDQELPVLSASIPEVIGGSTTESSVASTAGVDFRVVGS